ncbi:MULTISPECIES: SLAP domain-containing protein [Cytobacillus]|uniref:SLAP domain-containing protein n=1 Tax=Cytobacillus stercorigallinarum TaxID=2762240 RepID=A0ABR8QRZ9_9BACI|nr:SLAP domain-containing protein [Cytobacillus stercorigallinarum]MBD7938329.1 SLAP domain-containing protein [Cytobacillus stercorigallinarum]
MHSLVFQEKWASTLSDKDRKEIEGIFSRSVPHLHKEMIDFTPIWQAKNHRGDLLISVLIQNTTKEAFVLEHTHMFYLAEDGTRLAQHIFTTNQMLVEPNTSMPWTFIFPGAGDVLEKGVGRLVLEE